MICLTIKVIVLVFICYINTFELVSNNIETFCIHMYISIFNFYNKIQNLKFQKYASNVISKMQALFHM